MKKIYILLLILVIILSLTIKECFEENKCSLEPVNTQLININSRLDALEKKSSQHDTSITSNTTLINSINDKLKQTEQELQNIK